MDLFELNRRANTLNPQKVVEDAILLNKKDIVSDYQRMQLMHGLTPYNRYLSFKTKSRNKKSSYNIDYRDLKLNMNQQAGGNWDLNFTGKLYSDMYLGFVNKKPHLLVKGNVEKLRNLTKISLKKFGDDNFLDFTESQIEYTVNVYILPNIIKRVNEILFR